MHIEGVPEPIDPSIDDLTKQFAELSEVEKENAYRRAAELNYGPDEVPAPEALLAAMRKQVDRHNKRAS